MADWRTQTLGDLCTLRGGGAFPQDEQGSTSGDYPFIKVSDLADSGTRNIRTARNWVTRSQLERMTAPLIPSGATVFAKIGEGLRRERFRMTTQETAIDNNLMAAIPRRTCDPRFLCYLLSTLGISDFAAGSALPYLRQSTLQYIECRVPSLTAQAAIGQVLGALDDKIAANTQLVASSLDLVRALFRSTSRLTPSRSTTYGEIAQVDGGGTPSTKVPAFWGGQIRWATPTDITSLRAPYLTGTARSITSDGLAACSSSLFAPGAILMTSRATIGAFAVNQIHTSVNQGFIVVRPNDPHATWWLFHEMESRVNEYISRANGATFLELPRGRFRALEVAPPRHDVLLEFDAKASAIHAKSAAAAAESRSLASLRDTLLPKLMSGELRVRDAEKQVEGVV